MKRIFDAFADAGKELFLVGGAVRDMAMGQRYEVLDDLDFATNARPEESLDILQKAGMRTYDVGIEFGTAGAILKGPRKEGYPKDVQVTTYRSSETYRRGSRHPTIKFGASIEEDLWRRDFSINSIAMDGNGEYVDPYKGRDDIKLQILRAVGDPMERLAEDPLRIMRVARFMAKLGFTPDDALEAAARARATWLLDIARQRWLQEMDKLLVGPHPEGALRFLMETGAMNIILPEVVALFDLHHRCPGTLSHEDFWEHTLARVAVSGKDIILSWASLLADTGRPWTRALVAPLANSVPGPELAGLRTASYQQEPIPTESITFTNHQKMAGVLAKGVARRFHFDNDKSDGLAFLLSHQGAALAYDESWGDPQVRHFVRDMQGTHQQNINFARISLTSTQASPARGEALSVLDRLEAHIGRLEAQGQLIPELPKGMGGHLMKNLGIRPGPILGELIAWLNEEIIEGRLSSGQEAAHYVAHLRQTRPPILTRVPGFHT